MPRILHVAAAQCGPISRRTPRSDLVARRIDEMREAQKLGCRLIVYPECALGAFFPHWYIEDPVELDAWFERDMPGHETQPLFDEAARLGIGFYLGYAELAIEAGRPHRYNSAVLADETGRVVGKYRKIHLPGHVEHRPQNPFQNLEQRYFEFGDRPFRAYRAFGGAVGMCICNDRRWPETYRLLGLAGAEMILCGYNTPDVIPEHPEIEKLAEFQNKLAMQAGAYQSACWVVGVAKAGVEEGVSQIGGTSIIAPSGEIVATASTRGDELITYECDLEMAADYHRLYNFERNRRTEHYGPLVAQRGPTPPPLENP
jgi:predicted amidohydrolase